MKKGIIIFLLCLGIQINAQEVSKEYKEAVIQLLDVSGAKSTFDAVVDSYLIYFNSMLEEDVDEAMKKELKDILEDVMEEELAELYAPIYAKHFSLNEINELITFYKTSLGQKLADKNPIIVAEAMNVSAEWGQELGQKIAKRLEEKGII